MCELAGLILVGLALAGMMHLSFIAFVSISIPPRHALLVDFTDATKFARCHSRVLHSLPFSFLFLLPHRSRLFLDLFSSFAFTDTCHFERSRSRILHSPFCIVCIACISCIARFACIVCMPLASPASVASDVSLAQVAPLVSAASLSLSTTSSHIFADRCISLHLHSICSHHIFATYFRIICSHHLIA